MNEDKLASSPKTAKAKTIRTWLCEKCGAELNTNEEYKQHKVDHTLGKISEVEIDPVSGEPKVDPSQPGEATVMPEESPKPRETHSWPSKSEPISLKYTYFGTCPNCSSLVETIPLDVELDKLKKHVVICWCNSCKRNIQQRMVARL